MDVLKSSSAELATRTVLRIAVVFFPTLTRQMILGEHERRSQLAVSRLTFRIAAPSVGQMLSFVATAMNLSTKFVDELWINL